MLAADIMRVGGRYVHYLSAFLSLSTTARFELARTANNENQNSAAGRRDCEAAVSLWPIDRLIIVGLTKKSYER